MDPTLSGRKLVRISREILEDGMQESQSSDRHLSSDPIAVREFRRIETKEEMTFEEQLAIRDAIASVGCPSSYDDLKLESAPSSAKSHGFAGFDLRGMVGRMFRGNSGARTSAQNRKRLCPANRCRRQQAEADLTSHQLRHAKRFRSIASCECP